jgi:hypothetical protein
MIAVRPRPNSPSGGTQLVTTSSISAPQQFRGRRFLLLGVGLSVVGVVAYVVQIALERLIVPWYMPVLASLGVVFIIISLVRRRTVWRILALTLVVLLAGAEWAMIYALRLPAYTGPIAVGLPFPAFETTRADGTPFAQRNLAGDQNTVLVFFRGRW